MEPLNTSPIKRHKAIVKFSQEHHFGLLLVWKIREGIKKNIDAVRIARYTVFIYDNNLKQHFQEEENLLFSRISEQESLKHRAFAEHQSIYDIIEQIRKTHSTHIQLAAFADLLDKHIRFEERELFNYMQQHFGEDQLEEITNQHHSEKVKDVDGQWDDHFWLK
ncbi:MAG TPA: hemerythrin domain-containing protein [Chitinophagaceae bacterium]|jgi:hemerythrin-like domain-containing protein|nr:hemerythrin domain-containing protein [Chitinophagaceae bacterium]